MSTRQGKDLLHLPSKVVFAFCHSPEWFGGAIFRSMDCVGVCDAMNAFQCKTHLSQLHQARVTEPLQGSLV